MEGSPICRRKPAHKKPWHGSQATNLQWNCCTCTMVNGGTGKTELSLQKQQESSAWHPSSHKHMPWTLLCMMEHCMVERLHNGEWWNMSRAVVKRCLVRSLFLTSVCIVDCHAIRILRSVLSTVRGYHKVQAREASSVGTVLTHLICTRVTSQVWVCILVH